MKIRSTLAIGCVLALLSQPSLACSPEDAIEMAEKVAQTINRIAAGDPDKANQLHTQLLELQQRDPTRSEHGPCRAYERIIEELEARERGEDPSETSN
ncbi:hypothetical protein CK507_00805 [Pseudomonas sp. WN033]|nr:hypothetical protein CK507_00805 [Pseudomonas sp. WN033]